MPEVAPQNSLSDEDQNKENTIPLPTDASSQLYEKLNPVLQLFSRRSDFFLRPEVFLDHLLDQIRTVINPDLLLFFKCDEADQEWTLLFQHGLPKHLIKKGHLARAWQSLPTIVLHDDEPLFSDDITKDRRFIGQVIRGIDIHTFLGTTLRSKEKVYGSLSIGFYASHAIAQTDRQAFLILANLLCPFLSREITPQVKEGDQITLSLDLSGRIQTCNDSFLDLFGGEKEGLKNTSLSRFLTRAGFGRFMSLVKRLKAEEEVVSPFELEVTKTRGRKRLILAHMELTKKEGKPVGVELTAEDITKIAPLETELVYKNGLQSILNTIFSTLHQTSQHTSPNFIDEAQLLKDSVELGFTRLEIDGGGLLRFDDEKKKLHLIAERGLSSHQKSQLEKHGVGAKEHLLWMVIDKDAPTLMTAKSKKTSLKKRLFGDEDLISFIGVPVELEGRLWGVLVLFSREEVFTEVDLRALTTLGKGLELAIAQIDSFRILQKRSATLEDLNEVGHSITKSLHLEQLLPSIANNLKKLIDASNCYIFLEDGKRHLYYGAAASDQHSNAIQKVEVKMNENHLISLTARERHPFVIDNVPHEPRVGKKWVRTFKSRSLLSVPLMSKDRITGVLLLDETRYFRKFTSEEVHKVVEMAEQIAVGIENAILHHAVSRHRDRLQTLSSAIVTVQEEERRRIAKKLRKEVSTALTTILENLAWVKEAMESPSANMKDRLEQAQDGANKMFETLKTLSAELRPAALDDSGLVSTIKSVVNIFETQCTTKVHFQTNGVIKRLPARVEILLFRVIQEALTNISGHAKAESAIVSLEKREPYIHLYVTDDGKGFDVKRYFSSPQLMRKEIGILGMKERVELSGGTFFIDSQLGQGTRISVRIPIVRRAPQSST